MIKQSVQWLTALMMVCLMVAPASAAGKNKQLSEASFDLRSSARLATTDAGSGERTRVRFAGEGSGAVSADGVSLELGVLTQVEGDRALTITPNGDFVRRGRSRVFMGTGSAVVDNDGELTEFSNVRIMVKLRGKGERLRLIGKVKGVNQATADDDTPLPADVLHGTFRGQRVENEPEN